MRGFLKCYYGYQNLGDELLFWGVIDHIDLNWDEVRELWVEVGDVAWMESWRDRHRELMKKLHLARGFLSGEKTIHFIAPSKNILDNFRYDLYFLGGGEVFAESRGFHGGRNYLLRYLMVIFKQRFVVLGGIETAHHWRQKLVYRLILPRAQKIVCRDKISYDYARSYNPHHSVYVSDFAIPVIDSYRQWGPRPQLKKFKIAGKYCILNITASMSNDESYDSIRRYLHKLGDDITPVYVSGKSINSDDRKFASRLEGAYPTLRRFDRELYDLEELFALIAGAESGLAARLHILLLLQQFNKPRYALAYAEKVTKLINSSLDLIDSI